MARVPVDRPSVPAAALYAVLAVAGVGCWALILPLLAEGQGAERPWLALAAFAFGLWFLTAALGLWRRDRHLRRLAARVEELRQARRGAL